MHYSYTYITIYKKWTLYISIRYIVIYIYIAKIALYSNFLKFHLLIITMMIRTTKR